MKVCVKFGGSGGSFGQSIVQGTGDKKKDLRECWECADEGMAFCEMGEFESGIVDYFVKVTENDEHGAVLFEKEGRIPDKSGALKLKDGEYAARCECDEEGIWQVDRFEVSDAAVKRHVAKFLKERRGDRAAAVRDYFEKHLEFCTASVSGFVTVCSRVLVKGAKLVDEACGEYIETDCEGAFLTAVDSKGKEYDLDSLHSRELAAAAAKKPPAPKPPAKKKRTAKKKGCKSKRK